MIPEILYEDQSLLIAVKPVGYLSEPGQGKSFPNALEEWYASQGKTQKIFTVHRLDKIVGGVMVFAKDQKTASYLTKLVAERDIKKEYLAVLRGVPEKEEDTLRDLLFRDASKNKTFVVKRMRKGVRDASLDYRLLGIAEKDGQALSLVRVNLHTGRTHQIRVQFSSRKLPLLGDIRYGSKDPNCTAALWSWRLSFPHPNGKVVDIRRPPDEKYPWSLFEKSLPLGEGGTAEP